MIKIILESIVSGVLLGGVYALMGTGLNLIYGVMRVVNYAHGQFIMLASYSAYWLYIILGLDPLKSLVMSLPMFFAIGVIAYQTTARRFFRAEDPEMASFIAYFGLSLAIAALALLAWGADTRSIPFLYHPISISFFEICFPVGRLIAFGASLLIVLCLFFFLYKTYYGKAIRAIIENRTGAEILGIDSEKISTLTFGIGLMLAGASGALITLVFPAIYPGMGSVYTTIAFVIIVLGGLGDPLGAVIGGIIYGVAESLSTVFLPLALAPVVAFLILIFVIILKPQGLLYRG